MITANRPSEQPVRWQQLWRESVTDPRELLALLGLSSHAAGLLPARDTGFADALPVGDGLLAFDTADEAAAAIERVRAGYPQHARAARELAEAYLDSDRVLTSLLEAL